MVFWKLLIKKIFCNFQNKYIHHRQTLIKKASSYLPPKKIWPKHFDDVASGQSNKFSTSRRGASWTWASSGGGYDWRYPVKYKWGDVTLPPWRPPNRWNKKKGKDSGRLRASKVCWLFFGQHKVQAPGWFRRPIIPSWRFFDIGLTGDGAMESWTKESRSSQYMMKLQLLVVETDNRWRKALLR